MVQCATYVVPLTLVAFMGTLLVLRARLRVLPGIWVGLLWQASSLLLLLRHRRVVVERVPVSKPPPLASVSLMRRVVHDELRPRLSLAPAVGFALGSTVLYTTISISRGSEPTWVTWDTCPGDVPARSVCYRPELLLAVTFAAVLGARCLFLYDRRQRQPALPVLDQAIFLRLKPALWPAFRAACRLCLPAYALVLFAVGLFRRSALAPALAAVHAATLSSRSAVMDPAAACGWSTWLQLLATGLAFSWCWETTVVVANAVFTQRVALSRSAVRSPPHDSHPLEAALANVHAPFIQQVALVDLCAVARFDSRRRRELFADPTGAALYAVIDSCSGRISTLAQGVKAFDGLYARVAVATTSLLSRRWRAFVVHRAAYYALEGAAHAALAASSISCLLSASRVEDQFGLVQTAQLVERELDRTVQCLEVLEGDNLASLLISKRTGMGVKFNTRRRLGMATPGPRSVRPAPRSRRGAVKAHVRVVDPCSSRPPLWLSPVPTKRWCTPFRLPCV